MLKETSDFKLWIRGLGDRRAVGFINIRLRKLDLGNPGDVEPVGEGVSELKIDYGPGYRVYYRVFEDGTIILYGGIKDTQPSDIVTAKDLANKVAAGTVKAT